MAMSCSQLRISLARTLFVLHRCFLSAGYVRLNHHGNHTSDSKEAMAGAGQDKTEDGKDQDDIINMKGANQGDSNNIGDRTIDQVASQGTESMKMEHSNETVVMEEVKQHTDKKLYSQEGGMSENELFFQSTFEDSSDQPGSDSEQGYDSDEFYDTEDEIRLKVLDAALNHVNIYGWSSDAIAAGAEDVGLSAVAEGMFKRGGGDLVLHFIESCNIELAEHLASVSRLCIEEKPGENVESVTSDFIRDAIKTRLRFIEPHILLGTWPQAMGLLLLPQNAPDALENVAHMVDEIWYHAGDTSTDVDWYARRGTLAALYGATELYMVRDRSKNFVDTWDFLDRRLKDIANAATAKKKVEGCVTDTLQLASVGFSMARNMLGLNSRVR